MTIAMLMQNTLESSSVAEWRKGSHLEGRVPDKGASPALLASPGGAGGAVLQHDPGGASSSRIRSASAKLRARRASMRACDPAFDLGRQPAAPDSAAGHERRRGANHAAGGCPSSPMTAASSRNTAASAAARSPSPADFRDVDLARRRCSTAIAPGVLKSSSIASAKLARGLAGLEPRRRLDAAQREVEALQRGIRLEQVLVRVVDRRRGSGTRAGRRAAPPARSRGSTSRTREEVAERLRHLLVVHAHEAVVHPELRERRVAGRAALRDLVLVVRELEVHAAAVDVELLGPSSATAIAEHSMCQPGRPAPQGESQAGSPGLARFQSTKSSGSRFASSTSTRAPARRSSSFLPESWPYSGSARPRNRRRRSRRRRHSRSSISRPIIATISGMYCVARGSWSGFSTPSAAKSSSIAAMKRAVSASIGSPRSAARSMILSSMSVMLRT